MQATTSVSSPATASARSPRSHILLDPLNRVDRELERDLEADMRLLYGMLIPILAICGVIVWLVFSRSYWVVGAAVVLEVAALTLIVVKLMAMLNEGENAADSVAGER